MKNLRFFALAALCGSTLCFGANKDLEMVRRDIGLLQDDVSSMKKDFGDRLTQLQTTVQQLQDSSARSNAQLQDAVTNGVGKQLAPMSNLGSRVDSMSEDVRSLKDALNDLGARLERMDAKITDLKNQMQIMQSPPPAPGSGPAPTGGAGAPPAGMSADKTFTDARRDQQSGNLDLAYQEYQQYLQYFPNTELAASAQYYLGEIDYNRAAYDKAIGSFDAVLERYPNNPKTADARWMKGMALLRSGQKSKAIQEFRALVQESPRTDAARRAQQQLKTLGAASTGSRRRG